MSASYANKTSIFIHNMRLYRNERELMWSGQVIRVNVSCLCLCIRHCVCVHLQAMTGRGVNTGRSGGRSVMTVPERLYSDGPAALQSKFN